MKEIRTDYFYGNEVSEYGKERGYVDYATLSKAFDAVLCNDITSLFYCTINGVFNEVELINGYDDKDATDEIYQYYIISEYGANILQEWTNEIVYYIESLNMYIWGVTHFGTSWNYVLTDIKINKEL